jgi:hypothetical protein
MTSVILLGAGASFGSGDVSPSIPPLGNDPDGLFARLETVGGQAANLPEDLKSLFRSDFEKGMAKFYEDSNGNIMRFQREIAAYLAQFTPGAKNAYVRLIQTVGVRRAIYASLNYDLLFELAAGSQGIKTCYGVEPLTSEVRLLKLHGSSNFWPDIPAGMLKNVTVANSVRADVQALIRPLNQNETLDRCAIEDSLAPAIAMYAEGKTVKISPDYVEQQQALWKTAVSDANKVFVVGVRVHNADAHIWGELAKTKASITYFGRCPDREAYEEWKTGYGKKHAYFIEATFQESIGIIGHRLRI